MGRLPKEESERRRNGRSRIRLKEIREFLNLNKQTMANILGIPAPIYIQYEKGDYDKKSIMPIITMAKKMDISVDYLLSLTDISESYPKQEKEGIIGQKIREYRSQNKIPGEILAKKIGLDRQCLYNRERSITPFRTVEIIQMARLLHLPMDYLLEMTDETTPRKRCMELGNPTKYVDVNHIKEALRSTHNEPLLEPPKPKEEKTEYLAKNRIRQIREENGLHISEIAQAIGIDQGTYQTYEKTPEIIPAGYLKRMAAVYQVSIDYLLGLTLNRKINK